MNINVSMEHVKQKGAFQMTEKDEEKRMVWIIAKGTLLGYVIFLVISIALAFLYGFIGAL